MVGNVPKARYESMCLNCGKTIHVGDKIIPENGWWVHGELTKCDPEKKAEYIKKMRQKEVEECSQLALWS